MKSSGTRNVWVGRTEIKNPYFNPVKTKWQQRNNVWHLLPSREHQQAHGAALQCSSSRCFSTTPLHLLFLIHQLFFIFTLLLQTNLFVSLFFLPLFFSTNTCWWCHCLPAVVGRLRSFGESLKGCCLVIKTLPRVRGQRSVRWVWCHFGLYWRVMLGQAEPEWTWTRCSPLKRQSRFREGSDFFTEVTPSLVIQLWWCWSLQQHARKKQVKTFLHAKKGENRFFFP